MKTIKLLSILAIWLCLASSCTSYDSPDHTTYYVDSLNGSDSYDGSIDTPFQTIEKVNQLNLHPGDKVLFRRGTYYRGPLYPSIGDEDADIYYGAYGEGKAPIIACSINASKEEDWSLLETHIYLYKETIPYDVGNIILNSGDQKEDYFTVNDTTIFGVKKWTYDEMAQTGDYYYNMDTQELFLYCEESPRDNYFNIECCIDISIIDQSACSYVTYENLALTFGSSHGIGGGNTHHITIRNMEISYIGGSFLHYQNEQAVRYGNAIEFWANAHDNLVENCLIYEIFDTGVTNQNNGNPAKQERITYQNNIIYNCGMASFEIDNGPKQGTLEDICFINNTCSNVGGGFAMTQDRYTDPEQNLGLSHHVSSFYIETPTQNILISNNTFDGYTHSDGLGSFYLLNNIAESSIRGIIIKDNTYLNGNGYFGIIVNQGEVDFVDYETFNDIYSSTYTP